MHEFKELWKQLAKDKAITREDTLQFCILRALAVKNPDKLAVARGILQSAFTPITNEVKLKNGQEPYGSLVSAAYNSIIRSNRDRPGILLPVLENEDEVKQYNDLLSQIKDALYEDINEYYSYVIVRTDLPHEQMAVQSIHAATKVGLAILRESPLGAINEVLDRMNRLNVVFCGVKNLDELLGTQEYLYSNGYDLVDFREPDINDELTAIMSFPIKSTKRGFMKRYRTIRF